MESVTQAFLGFIGGSSTLAISFPEDISSEGLEILQTGLTYQTPFGESPAFSLLEVKSKNTYRVLCCQMHGWRWGVTRAQASQQVFWVFQQAGVKKVISEGGVGSLNILLDPLDIVIPDDYLDFSLRKDVGLGTNHLLIMRQPVCPHLSSLLLKTAVKYPLNRVFKRGVYVVTDGRHFESPSEVKMFKNFGGDIIGQSFVPEVYLAREIGVCFAGIYLVVNYGEGLVEDWDYPTLRTIFYEDAHRVGKIILEFMKNLAIDKPTCSCLNFRKPTLLEKVYK